MLSRIRQLLPARKKADQSPDARIKRVQELQARLAPDPNGMLSMTAPLRTRDFLLIGKLVQIYCYADLNARRVVDVIQCELTGPEDCRAAELNDKDALEALQRIVQKHLPPGNLRSGMLKAHATIEMHRIHRHNFAHWAARRVRGEDALIIFSKNAREARKRDGGGIEHDELKYGLALLPSLRTELSKLEGHAEYLARAAAEMDGRRDELRRMLINRPSQVRPRRRSKPA